MALDITSRLPLIDSKTNLRNIQVHKTALHLLATTGMSGRAVKKYSAHCLHDASDTPLVTAVSKSALSREREIPDICLSHMHHHHHHHHHGLAMAPLNRSSAAPYKVCLVKIIAIDCY